MERALKHVLMYQSGKFVSRNRDIGRAILMLYIYLLVNACIKYLIPAKVLYQIDINNRYLIICQGPMAVETSFTLLNHQFICPLFRVQKVQ